jgi:choline-sulfatase
MKRFNTSLFSFILLNLFFIICSSGLFSQSLVRDFEKGKGESDRPNILFITTDYQSGEDGPSLGSPFLDMPALDRLCKNGVVFNRYYSTAPVCQPARMTWLTGQYPHTHGMWNNNKNHRIPEDSPILMKELDKHGYYTLGIGKMHFNPWDRMAGFHRRIIADRKGNLERDKEYRDDYAQYLEKFGLTRWDYLKLQYESDLPHVYDWPFPPECHIDHYVGTQAQKVIENGELDDDKPWFLWVSFDGPHNPWDPPAEYSKPYMEMDLPKPRTYSGEMNNKPISNTSARYGYTKEVPDYVDRYPEQEKNYIKRIRAGHYGGLTFIDRQVEKILEALEKKNELDDTIIIYSADHGSLLGDHGTFHKGSIYERSVSVPFIVHCPARFRPQQIDALAGHVDLMPTILSLAGATIPSAVEGKDMTPLFSGQKKSIQDHVMIEIGHNIGIIEDSWKMFVYPNGEGELYNIDTDPDELKNLYFNPQYTKIKEELKIHLITFNSENALRFDVDPPKSIVVKNEYHFKQGEIIKQGKEPFPPPQAGKLIHISAFIEPIENKPPVGAFFVCEEMIPAWPSRPPQNGYALYVIDGRLAMGIRLWNKDTLITSPNRLPEGKVLVEGILGKDGEITLKVNNTIVATGKVESCLPVRRGRQEVVAPSIYVGIGHDWGTSIGSYDRKADFQGKISDVILKLY